MRWVISTAAFFVPLLLVIAIAGTCSRPAAGTPPVIGYPALGELRTWVRDNLTTLDFYAGRPGSKPSSAIPHLALERFELLGCDSAGNPWYRLASAPGRAPCGVLRQASAGPASPDGGAYPVRLFELTGGWSYWERCQAGPEARP